MTEPEQQEWAVVRLATLTKKNESAKMLFATVTELSPGRSLPTVMKGVDSFKIKGTDEKIWFRRIIQSKKEAIEWYLSLGREGSRTPIPTRENDRERGDGTSIYVSPLEDDQPWPRLGLPMKEDLFSRHQKYSINPAPFIGSIPARIHRRFGEKRDFESFVQDEGACAFIARRLHIDLSQYQEYLGSAVYIAPDPVIKQIDNFMTPSKDGHGERIVYRIVPQPGQSLERLSLTTFDKEARLLTEFKTYSVPEDGILEIDKGSCLGEYGFVITHDKHGVLTYQPPTGFLRQMNLSILASPNTQLKVNVPSGNAKNASRTEYQAAPGSEVVSQTIMGKVDSSGNGYRVNKEERKREIAAAAKYYGQRWFPAGSREQALHFIRELLRAANSRVIIADPYLGALQISQFLYVIHGSEVAVTLLTTKNAFIKDEEQNAEPLTEFTDALVDLKRYQKLIPTVGIIPVSKLHDRFLVVDDDVWFIGNSLNSLGEKASMIVCLPNPNEVIDRLQELMVEAQNLDEYIDKRAKQYTSGKSNE